MIEIKNPYAKQLCRNKIFSRYVEEDRKMFGRTRNFNDLKTIIMLGANIAGLRNFFTDQDFNNMASNMLESLSNDKD